MNRGGAALVVTSIAAPNDALRVLAEGCASRKMRFIVVGDSKSPADFRLQGCEFFSLADQRSSGLEYAPLCPERTYARKNIGYLLAMRTGVEVIQETDDDNYPRDAFWDARKRKVRARFIANCGWVNAYSYFTDEKIWPRGLPLNEVQNKFPSPSELPTNEADCPIQQGLADENPDVDAVYRLLFPLPVRFSRNRELILGRGSWCPFNSQNTTWWRDAFPLLYLPANCSFRMTDIWRSFVAQRIAHINEWSILFHAPTVWQDRNEHDLMRDFEDEVPGYLLNSSIRASLERLHLQPGTTEIPNNLRICYEAMIRLGAVSAEEMPLLEAWIRDVGRLC